MYSEEDIREAFSQGQNNTDFNHIHGWTSKLTEQEWVFANFNCSKYVANKVANQLY